MMSRIILLLVIVQVHQVINTPLGVNEKQPHVKIITSNIPTVSSHEEGKHPVLTLIQPQHVRFVNNKINSREKKGLSLPVTHHLLVPTNLHVIPIHSNIHHNTIHTGVNLFPNDHVKLVSHPYPHGISNTTHSTSLIPILIPIHTHLVPLHDLRVIPLHRPIHNVEPKFSHYTSRTTMVKRNNDEEEPVNTYRSYYGGYGNGLYIGGHGAGHGFYAYG